MFKDFLFVAMGGALGSVMRFGITVLAVSLNLSSITATFTANILGSFLIGIFMTILPAGTALLFTTVGICGGFTTFSTFSAQTLEYIQDGAYLPAFLYAFISIASCVAFVGLGMLVGRNL